MVRRLALGTTRALLVVLAVGALAACFRPRVESSLPTGARRFSAPPVYGKWWAMTSECSGATGSMSTVQWFVVPGVSLFWRDGNVVNGYWSREGNAIVLAEGAVEDGAVVRHEMLHALQDEGRHTRTFMERCAGIVGCMSACVQAARGSAPVVAALPRASASEMLIDVAIDPLERGLSGDGYFALTVSVRNPSRDSVVVVLPPSPESAAVSWFRFELTNGTVVVMNSTPARSRGRWSLHQGETRRAVFDLRLSQALEGAGGLTPGTYAVRGGFGTEWSVPKSFVVGQ